MALWHILHITVCLLDLSMSVFALCLGEAEAGVVDDVPVARRAADVAEGQNGRLGEVIL